MFSFWTGVSSKQEVNQSPEVLTVKEGDSLFLNCSYTDSAIYSLQWYRQDPGKGLTFLLIQSSPGVQETGRIKDFFDKTSRHSALHIASAQLSDSATYLCAVRHSAQQPPVTNTQTLQLRLQPHVLFLKLRNLTSPLRGFQNWLSLRHFSEE